MNPHKRHNQSMPNIFGGVVVGQNLKKPNMSKPPKVKNFATRLPHVTLNAEELNGLATSARLIHN